MGNAKYEKDTSTHQRRAGIRTRAEVKDDTVSDSFPAGERDEREKKSRERLRGGESGDGRGGRSGEEETQDVIRAAGD